jgi:hypothetical protein
VIVPRLVRECSRPPNQVAGRFITPPPIGSEGTADRVRSSSYIFDIAKAGDLDCPGYPRARRKQAGPTPTANRQGKLTLRRLSSVFPVEAALWVNLTEQ